MGVPSTGTTTPIVMIANWPGSIGVGARNMPRCGAFLPCSSAFARLIQYYDSRTFCPITDAAPGGRLVWLSGRTTGLVLGLSDMAMHVVGGHIDVDMYVIANAHWEAHDFALLPFPVKALASLRRYDAGGPARYLSGRRGTPLHASNPVPGRASFCGLGRQITPLRSNQSCGLYALATLCYNREPSMHMVRQDTGP